MFNVSNPKLVVSWTAWYCLVYYKKAVQFDIFNKLKGKINYRPTALTVLL